MKIVSPDLPHKSDVGGVELGLEGREAIEAAAHAMFDRVHRARPEARLSGFLVSQVVGGGLEMVVGVHRDPVFGPILTIGFGGTLVEVLGDVVHLHLPADEAEILAALATLRGRLLLEGVRGTYPVDRAGLASTIARIARAVFVERDRLAEVEVNPLIVGTRGRPPIAVDALLRPA